MLSHLFLKELNMNTSDKKENKIMASVNTTLKSPDSSGAAWEQTKKEEDIVVVFLFLINLLALYISPVRLNNMNC